MNAPLLGVNIDHVATLRQARGTAYPSVVEAARVAEAAGADLITVHLREDRRHIQDGDLEELPRVVTTRLNLEMAVTNEMLAIALHRNPADVCLVPERRQELTTEGGLDVARGRDRIQAACARLGKAGIRVSLFVDPEAEQLEAAVDCGAPVVELHTGAYAEASGSARVGELERIRRAAALGRRLGLVVNAGHGLNLDNVGPITGIDEIVELNIGHSIISRAVFVGLAEAVREMKAALNRGSPETLNKSEFPLLGS